MKKYSSIILLFMGINWAGFSQSKNQCRLELGSFKLETDPAPGMFLDSYDWYINRQHVNRKQDIFAFSSNYPGFDTIYFSNNEEQDTVVTRFKPGRSYYFTIGAGMAGFDVYDKKTSHRKPAEPDHGPNRKADSLWCLKQSPVIDLKIENMNVSDSLLCFFADFYGCDVAGKYVTQNSALHFTYPYKQSFEANLNYIRVARMKGSGKATNFPNVYLSNCKDLDILASVRVRFMYQEKLQAVYNASTGKLSLTIK